MEMACTLRTQTRQASAQSAASYPGSTSGLVDPAAWMDCLKP